MLDPDLVDAGRRPGQVQRLRYISRLHRSAQGPGHDVA